MRRTALLVALCVCACTTPGGNDGGTGGGSGGSGGSGGEGGGSGGGSGGAGGGVAKPERFIAADDGTAVLWVRDGGAPAEVNISVTHTDAGYVFAPDGLQFEVPSILFVPAPGPDIGPDGGVLPGLEAFLTASDGGVEAVRTVRAAVVGNDGRQFGLAAFEVPHFSFGSLYFDRSGISLQVTQEGKTHFRKNLQEEFNIRIQTQVPTGPGTVPPPSYVVTAMAAGSLTLLDGTLSSPGRMGANGANYNLSFDAPVKCTSEGPAFFRVVLTAAQRTLTEGVIGICTRSDVAIAVEGALGLGLVPENDAFGELLDQAFDAMGANPPADTQPVRNAVDTPTPPAFSYQLSLTLPCTQCPVNVQQVGKLSVTNTGTQASWVSAARAFGHSPVDVTSPRENFLNVPVGQTADFPITYVCRTAGTGKISAGFGYHPSSSGGPNGPPSPGAFFGVGPQFIRYETYQAGGKPFVEIRCGGGDQDSTAMLSDVQRMSRSSNTWMAAAPGVTANCMSPDAALRARTRPLDQQTSIYGGVTTFSSNAGLSPLTFTSGGQNATATHNGTRYVFTGLMAGAGFLGSSDTLTVRHNASGTQVQVTPPPAVSNVNALFGAPNKWATTITFADGSADTVAVYATFRPPGTPTPAGSYGLSRVMMASGLPLNAGYRSMPFLPPELARELDGYGWSVQTIYVALFNSAPGTSLFPSLDPVPVQAGRMFQFSATDLTF